jgi:hypothetical protein
MLDQPEGRNRTRRGPRPNRVSLRGGQLAFTTVVVIVMCTVILLAERFFTWLYVVPWAATALSLYCYRRDKQAKTLGRGAVWALAQCALAAGAVFAIALPATFG